MMTLEDLRIALVELDEKQTVRAARELLASGEALPQSILGTCQSALKVVGERYERREYYLAALIMAGEIFTRVLNLVEPNIEPVPGERSSGKVVLGTVAGDIHDIGKNMFGQALRTFGFTVVDLGEDVKDERFLEAVRTHRPDVLCLSGLISIAFESMKRVVDLVRADSRALGYMPPVVLGGGTVDSEVCQYAGADSWSTDAMEGVRICEGLVTERGRAKGGSGRHGVSADSGSRRTSRSTRLRSCGGSYRSLLKAITSQPGRSTGSDSVTVPSTGSSGDRPRPRRPSARRARRRRGSRTGWRRRR